MKISCLNSKFLYLGLALITSCLANSVAAADPILLKTRKVSKQQFGIQNSKRDVGNYSSDVLGNEGYLYVIDIEVGTPSQILQLQVDTGSSDFWAFASDNPYCEGSDNSSIDDSDKVDCSDVSLFNYENSSTFNFNSSSDVAWDFYIQYGDDTFAAGKWATDVVKISDIVLDDASIGVASAGNATPGILGIGFPSNEVPNIGGVYYPTATTVLPAYATSDTQQEALPATYEYDNIPLQMYKTGQIGAWAYSMWLDDANATVGNLLFGGVDHAKYESPLVTMPIISDYEMIVELTQMYLVDINGQSSDLLYNVSAVPALLDSGSSLYSFPSPVARAIADALGYTYDSDANGWVGDCSVADNDNTAIVFNFGSKNITVALHNILRPRKTGNLCRLPDTSGVVSDVFILGDVIMRSMYIVYDLQNKQISIAQAKFDADSSDIQALNDSGVLGVIEDAEEVSGLPSTVVAASVVEGELDATLEFEHSTMLGLSDFPTSIYRASTFPLFTGSSYAELLGSDVTPTSGSTISGESTGSAATSSATTASSTKKKSSASSTVASEKILLLSGVFATLLTAIIML